MAETGSSLDLTQLNKAFDALQKHGVVFNDVHRQRIEQKYQELIVETRLDLSTLKAAAKLLIEIAPSGKNLKDSQDLLAEIEELEVNNSIAKLPSEPLLIQINLIAISNYALEIEDRYRDRPMRLAQEMAYIVDLMHLSVGRTQVDLDEFVDFRQIERSSTLEYLLEKTNRIGPALARSEAELGPVDEIVLLAGSSQSKSIAFVKSLTDNQKLLFLTRPEAVSLLFFGFDGTSTLKHELFHAAADDRDWSVTLGRGLEEYLASTYGGDVSYPSVRQRIEELADRGLVDIGQLFERAIAESHFSRLDIAAEIIAKVGLTEYLKIISISPQSVFDLGAKHDLERAEFEVDRHWNSESKTLVSADLSGWPSLLSERHLGSRARQLVSRFQRAELSLLQAARLKTIFVSASPARTWEGILTKLLLILVPAFMVVLINTGSTLAAIPLVVSVGAVLKLRRDWLAARLADSSKEHVVGRRMLFEHIRTEQIGRLESLPKTNDVDQVAIAKSGMREFSREDVKKMAFAAQKPVVREHIDHGLAINPDNPLLKQVAAMSDGRSSKKLLR